MKKQYLLGSFIITALLIPVLTSAATADEIRAQIQLLLSQITDLQTQLNNLTSGTQTTISTSPNSCPNLYRALSRGSRGSDVISLQQFLIAQGLLSSDSATGFFGSMTEGAVQRWQAQNSVVASGDANSTGYGVVGVRTRAAIVARCGTKPPEVQACPQYQTPICTSGQHVQHGTTDASGCRGAPTCVNDIVVQSCPTYAVPACSNGKLSSLGTDTNGCNLGYRCVPIVQPATPVQQGSFSASPANGTAPLGVTFSSTYGDTTGYRPSFIDGVDTMLDFGDRSELQWLQCPNQAGQSGVCSTAVNMRHTYSQAGTYTASVKRTGGFCAGTCPVQTLATTIITVSSPAQTSDDPPNPLASQLPQPFPTSGIRIITPNGGETLADGQQYTVRWDLGSWATYISDHPELSYYLDFGLLDDRGFASSAGIAPQSSVENAQGILQGYWNTPVGRQDLQYSNTFKMRTTLRITKSTSCGPLAFCVAPQHAVRDESDGFFTIQ